MNVPLAEMLRYNKWATSETINACRELTEEQIDALVAGVSGSVRQLLIHIVGAQQTFVLRTKGRQHEGELNLAHGVEHRTEIKVALGHIGVETPDLDGWSYAPVAGYGEDVTG